MSKHRRTHGLSVGTIVMLTLTAVSVAGFFALYQRLTGNVDISTDARQIAVAIDDSFSQFADTVAHIQDGGTDPAFMPQFTATVVPLQTAAPNVTASPGGVASADNAVLPVITLTPSDAVTAYQTAAPNDAAAPNNQSFTMCALGSIRINSDVQRAYNTDTGYRYDLLFDQLGDALQSDLTIATLDDIVAPSLKLSDFNIPVEAVYAMRDVGVDALCLSHFNTLNGGISGLSETKQSITEVGLAPYGAYTSAEERTQTKLVSVGGVSVALLAYLDGLSDTGKNRTTRAERDIAVAGTAIELIAADIQNAKAAGAQVVLVSLCWGTTNSTAPNGAQQKLAQQIADAGADIIIGTHPNALQTVRILTADRGDGQYHPTLCAYSMGNFFTYDREKRVGLSSAILSFTVEYDHGSVAFSDLTYTPTYSWRGKPQSSVYYYRTLINNGEYPDFVDDSQKRVMEKCLKIVTDALVDFPK